MAYVDFSYCTTLYCDIPAVTFNRLVWDAERKVDNATTGVDGVKKLRVSFPTDEDDAENVKRCICKLIHLMYQVETAEQAASRVSTENGLRGGIVSSVSAGNESISYATSGATMVEKAVSDRSVLEKELRDTIREYLSGVTDANGVNLLYMGAYPVEVKHGKQ